MHVLRMTVRASNNSATSRAASSGRRVNCSDGFSLLEVMIAILIIGIALSAAFASVSRSFSLMENSRDYTRAAQIIQSELEDLRTRSWDKLQELKSTEGEFAEFEPDGGFKAAYGDRYTCYRWIADSGSASSTPNAVLGGAVPDTISAGMIPPDQLWLFVFVQWQDGKGASQLKWYQMWYTKEGLNDYYYRTFTD